MPSLGWPGKRWSCSYTYRAEASAIWRRFEAQYVCRADSLALTTAGNNNAARIAMMAITMSNSIKVKPVFRKFAGVQCIDLANSPMSNLLADKSIHASANETTKQHNEN